MRENFKTRFKKDFNYLCALAIIFAAIGWIVENTFRAIGNGQIDNRFHLLPFIPVYGFIAFAAYIIGSPDDEFFFGYRLTKSKVWSNIIYYIVIACGVTFGELAVGNLWEICFGAKLWNYNNIPLHWTQYTSLPTTAGLATGAYLILKFGFYPLLNMLKERFTPRQAFGATIFYGILMADMIYMMIITAIKGEGQVYWAVNIKDGSIEFPMILDLIIFGVFNVYFILFLIVNGRYFSKNKKVISRKKESAKFAVLIPLKKSLDLLTDCIESIEKSDFNQFNIDIYVGVSENIEEVKLKLLEYFNVKILTISDCKKPTGTVLNEMVCQILSENNHYNSFIVLQDDNVVDRDFFARMSDAVLDGYDVISSNKDNRNWNDTKTSNSAGIMYLSNNHINSQKNKISETVRINESGYSVSYDIISKLGKWPFDTEAEDNEIVHYAFDNNLSSCYQHEAIFYDTNPLSVSEFINEKTDRFKALIYNYKHSKKKDFSNKITFGLALHFIFFVLYNMLLTILGFFTSIDSHKTFMFVVISIIAYYVIVFIFSLTILILDKKDTISARGILKQALFHPIFLLTYVVSFIKAMKNTKKEKKNSI